MTVLLAFIAGSVVTGTAVHTFHKFRFQTVGNDIADYRTARHATAVTPPPEQDGGVALARDVYRTADRYRRKLGNAEREILRLRTITYDLYDRLAGTPRPRRTVPVRGAARRRPGWRDRLRWFRPWPVAAICEPQP